jgi:CBS domain-containing protein
MSNWVDDFSYEPPRHQKIYLVYVSEDALLKDKLKENLSKHDFDFFDYQAVSNGQTVLKNYDEWNQQAKHVIIIVSNHWVKRSSYLNAELTYLLDSKNKRLDPYIYIVAFTTPDQLDKEAIRSVMGLGTIQYIPDKDVFTKTLDEFGRILKQSPKFVNEGNNKTLVNQTGTLSKPKVPLDAPISELMTKNPTTFSKSDYISYAIAYWRLKGFRHFPIVDERNILIGIATLRDIIQSQDPDPEVMRHLNLGGKMIFPNETEIEVIMVEHTLKTPLIYMTSTQSVKMAIELLEKPHELPKGKRRISAIPVLSTNGEIVGMVSYIDILRNCQLPNNLNVGQIMRDINKHEIKVVYETSTLSKAQEQMGNFRDLPVVNQSGELVGMITEYEIYKNLKSDPNTMRVPVSTVMRPIGELPIVKPSDDINTLIKDVFLQQKTLGAIVVRGDSTNSELQGIVSYVDVLRAILFYNSIQS